MWRRAVERLRHLLRDLFARDRVEQELDDEIRFHLEMEAQANEREGMDPEAARRAALRKFGGVARFKEAARDARGLRLIEDLHRDFRFALHSFSRRPVWSLVVVGTVAVGVGAATAIVSTADHVLLRSLPYDRVDRVVTLWEIDRSSGERQEVSPGNWEGWRRRTTSFEVTALAEPYGYDLTGDAGPPVSLTAWNVTEGYFRALGAEAMLGRTFRPPDFGPGAAPVVVLSAELWRSRFGADSAVVGSTITLDGAPTRVVGVMPEWVRYPGAADVWAPKTLRPGERRDRASGYMHAVARLKSGVSPEQARKDLQAAAEALARRYPETNGRIGAALVPLEEQVLGPVRPAFSVLLAGVLILLLVAAVNTTSLLLARGHERERELAVRSALGARPGRLGRQLLTEAGILGAGGGLLGLGLAAVALHAIRSFGPTDLPRMAAVGLDPRSLAAAAGLTLLVALAAGGWPAVRFSRPDLVEALKSGARTATSDPRRRKLQHGLVGLEVALALLLLVGAGLLGRSFLELLSNDPGFRVEGRASVQAFLWDRHPSREQRIRTTLRVLERMRAIPDVTGAAAVSALPFHPHAIEARDGIRVVGGSERPADDTEVYTTVASRDYFRVMGIPVLQGRAFRETDVSSAPPVAVISQSLADRLFPDREAVGRRVEAGVMGPPRTREVVGVVGDVRAKALDSRPREELYVPLAQHGTGSVTFVARSRGRPGPAIRRLEEAIWDVDPGQAVFHAGTLEELVRDTHSDRRFHLFLVGSFALTALALAIFGVYGTVSFATSRRTGEIGVRMALGARPRRILALLMSQGLRPVAAGAAVGLLAAVAASRALDHMLYQVPPVDPITYAAVSLVLLIPSAAAVYLPARRAASVDPSRTLESE